MRRLNVDVPHIGNTFAYYEQASLERTGPSRALVLTPSRSYSQAVSRFKRFFQEATQDFRDGGNYLYNHDGIELATSRQRLGQQHGD